MTEELNQEGSLNLSPEDTFAHAYATYMPQWREIMKNLSSKAKARVVGVMMEHPFNHKNIKVMSAEEHNAITMGLYVMEAKYAMIMFSEMAKIHDENAPIEQEDNNTAPIAQGETNE